MPARASVRGAVATQHDRAAAASLTRLWGTQMARIWLNPLILVSILLLSAAWLPTAAGAKDADLTVRSLSDADPGLLVAAVVFAASAMSTTRPRRSGVEETEDSLPAPDAARTLAALSATASVALVVAALFAVRMLLYRSESSVGTILWWEAAASGLIVAAAGALGHAVARLTRSLPIALVALLVLVIIGFLGYVMIPGLGTWVAGSAHTAPTTPPLPSDALGRPQAGRAAWLACVTLACTAFLLLRPPRPPRTAILPTACAVALTLTVGAGALITDLERSVPLQLERRAQLRDDPQRHRECTTVAGSGTRTQYCTLPGYANRVSAWSRIVDGVVSRTPEAARSPMVIAQYLPEDTPEGAGAQDGGDARSSVTGHAGRPQSPGEEVLAVPVSTRWAAPDDGEDFNQNEVAFFALSIAYAQVTGSTIEQAPPDGSCGARGAMALYLAQTASPASQAAFAALEAHSTGGGGAMIVGDPDTGTRLIIDTQEAALATAMRRSRAGGQGVGEGIDATITANWQALTDPGTTTEQAAGILGLPAPEASSVGACAQAS